jgi:hypothetical protein
MAMRDLAVDAREWNLGPGPERAIPSPLDWLSRLGMGLVSLAAKLIHKKKRAEDKAGEHDDAEDGVLAPYCCNLANPNGPWCAYSGNRWDYTCPPGYQKMWWYCCYGTSTLGCGECSSMTATNCWTPPWPCSMWWSVPGAKC